MTETDDERRERRRAQRRIALARDTAMTDGLAAWSALHNLVERDRGRGWCGHNLLGKRPRWLHQSTCAGEGPSWGWWDHTRGFGRGRQPLVILGWPYGSREHVEGRVRAYAEPLGLGWHVGDARGPLSLYFWGAATPWAITAPGMDAAALFAVSTPDLEDALCRAAEYGAARNDLAANDLRTQVAP